MGARTGVGAGEYDWTVHVRRRCGLFVNVDHLLLKLLLNDKEASRHLSFFALVIVESFEERSGMPDVSGNSWTLPVELHASLLRKRLDAFHHAPPGHLLITTVRPRSTCEGMISYSWLPRRRTPPPPPIFRSSPRSRRWPSRLELRCVRPSVRTSVRPFVRPQKVFPISI